MKSLRRLWSRLGGALTGRRREQELADELQSHIEMQIEDNLRAGMSPEEARRAAALKFGSVESAKESYRDQRGAPILENLVWDLRHALRGLRKNPGFTAIAVVTLALGIGAGTAIFSVADAVLFRPLPYAEPDRLYLLVMRKKGASPNYGFVPRLYLKALEEQHHGLSAAGILEDSSSIEAPTAGGVESIPARGVSANYFHILGVQAVRGRVFDPSDSGRVAMLSYGAWRRRFGGDEKIVGQSIKLGAATFDIVGILPENFVFPSQFGGRPEIVTILEPALIEKDTGTVNPILRLEPGVTRERAQAQIDAISAPLSTQNLPTAGTLPVLVDLRSTLYPVGRTIMQFLLAAAGLVLLIGCANLANMLLARTQRREREHGVRAALGASRARLMRPVILESVIVGLAAAALAVLVTSLSFDALLRQVPKAAYSNLHVGVNLRVVGLALALGLLGGLMFAVVPAWRTAHLDAVALIQGPLRRGGRKSRFGRPMIAVQVAVAIVLVFGAALTGRAFVSVLRTPLGFTPENVVIINVRPPRSTGMARQAFYANAVATLARRGDVLSAGAATALPLSGQGYDQAVKVAGGADGFPALHILPGYFETAGIRLLHGRLPNQDDLRGGDVAVVSESFARKILAGRDPLGVALEDLKGRPFTVIGVVADARRQIDSKGDTSIYIMPGESTRFMRLMARTRMRHGALLAELKREIRALAPNSPVTAEWWTDSIADMTEYRNPHFQTLVLGSFAALALGLTGLGIYGIVSFMVAVRTQEMGIRLAIGAAPRSLVYFMVRQAFAPVAVGILTGLLGTRWLSRLVQTQLYKVDTHDPVTLAAAACTVIAAAFLAAYIPARRVSRIDPVMALRHE